MFYVGQKVICVDDTPRAYQPNDLRVGEIYTIRTIFSCEDGIPGLLLAEIKSLSPWGFCSSRFRPLTDQKKSVSFTQGAPLDSERWDNRRKVVEPFPVDGWGA